MHKGDRGRVTVVGGSNGMTGAALHAARAALAAGAGLVKLVAGPETIQAARASLPDVLTLESALGPELEPAAAEALEWADALVVGPGLGRAPARAPFLQAVLARRPLPTVVDADALALFVGPVERPVVLTPHLGEFRAQFGDELADAAANDRRTGWLRSPTSGARGRARSRSVLRCSPSSSFRRGSEDRRAVGPSDSRTVHSYRDRSPVRRSDCPTVRPLAPRRSSPHQ